VIRDRLARYRDQFRRDLTAAFRAEHTPHQIGASFGLGIFVTALPTGGLGIALFFVFARLWSWINKPATFASIAVLNPFVKPTVYVASFTIGGILLGPRSIRSQETTAESTGIALQQLLVGNFVVAACLAIAAYVCAHQLTRANRRRQRQRSGPSIASTLLGLIRRR